jgi:hypothetical protein
MLPGYVVCLIPICATSRPGGEELRRRVDRAKPAKREKDGIESERGLDKSREESL